MMIFSSAPTYKSLVPFKGIGVLIILDTPAHGRGDPSFCCSEIEYFQTGRDIKKNVVKDS